MIKVRPLRFFLLLLTVSENIVTAESNNPLMWFATMEVIHQTLEKLSFVAIDFAKEVTRVAMSESDEYDFSQQSMQVTAHFLDKMCDESSEVHKHCTDLCLYTATCAPICALYWNSKAISILGGCAAASLACLKYKEQAVIMQQPLTRD